MIGSLFTGYGGLDIAAQQVFGLPLAFVSDIEPGPIAVQAHHHPDTPNLGDVSTIDWTPWRGRIDVLTGGFPCQDVSTAGARAGLGGARSGLWSEMLRAITELRPRRVVIENVRGLLSAKTDISETVRRVGPRGGTRVEYTHRAMGAVLGGLADAGYDARWCGLRAADVGACHSRYRIFLLAYPQGDSWRISHGDSTTARDTNGGDRERRPAAGLTRQTRLTPRSAALMPTPGANLGTNGGAQHPDKRRAGNHSVSLQDVCEFLPDRRFGRYAPAVEHHARIFGRPAPAPTEPAPRGGRRLSPRFVEWMMMLPAGHVTDIPGLIWKQQLRLLGNGVVPAQAEAALRHMMPRH